MTAVLQVFQDWRGLNVMTPDIPDVALAAKGHRHVEVLADDLKRLCHAGLAMRPEIVDGAPSSWRPPWLETMIASAPQSRAPTASSASTIPFRMIVPSQRSRIQSSALKLSVWSNWLPTYS